MRTLAGTAIAVATAACSIPEFHHPPGPPEIRMFETTPFRLDGPGEVCLRWAVERAHTTRLEEDGETPLEIPLEGGRCVTIDRSRRFTLVAEGAGGVTRATATVEVVSYERVHVRSFILSLDAVRPGEPVRAYWEVERAARIVLYASDGRTLIDRAPPAGSLVVRPERTLSLLLVAEGPGGPARAEREIRVGPGAPLILSFAALPPLSLGGTTTVLAWSVDRARTVRLSELTGSGLSLLEALPDPGPEGTLAVEARVGERTFVLEVENEAGTALETTTAIVMDDRGPHIEAYAIAPSVSGRGGDAIVSWRARDTDRVELRVGGAPWWRSAPAEGSAVIGTIHDTTRISILALDRAGRSDVRTSTVVIDPRLPAVAAETSPRAAEPGEPIELSFAVSSADRVRAALDSGAEIGASTAAAGTFTFAMSASGTVLFDAENALGRTRRGFPVAVAPRPVVLSFGASASVSRAGRPVRFDYATELASRGTLTAGVVIPLLPVSSGRLVARPPVSGDLIATLTAENELFTRTATLPLAVLPRADGSAEEEPNGSESTANEPFGPTGGAVEGAIAGDDVDMFVLDYDARVLRMHGTTEPPGACIGDVSIAIYEAREMHGLAGPVLVIPGNGGCPVWDPRALPALSGLEPPLVLALHRGHFSPLDGASAYRLFFRAEDARCGDGLADLGEACDDGNGVSGDGCSSSCWLEDVGEVEPNDEPALASPLGSALQGFLTPFDTDWFRLEVDALDRGPRSILLEAPGPGACDLDAELALFTEDGTTSLFSRAGDGVGCPLVFGPFAVLEPGAYLLRVRPGGGPSLPRKGRYVLTVTP